MLIAFVSAKPSPAAQKLGGCAESLVSSLINFSLTSLASAELAALRQSSTRKEAKPELIGFAKGFRHTPQLRAPDVVFQVESSKVFNPSYGRIRGGILFRFHIQFGKNSLTLWHAHANIGMVENRVNNTDPVVQVC